MTPVDRELVAGNCWAFGDGDCAGSVEWRTYPRAPNTSFAMCDFHWQRYGPDGPAGGPDGPAVVANDVAIEWCSCYWPQPVLRNEESGNLV
jgi:hypothetical protein